MSQSKRGSLIEAIVNTFIGFLTTLVFSPLFYWIADVKISLPKMGLVTLLFTILSILRNYVIRRWFTKGSKKKTHVESIADNRNYQ
jgi:uncharacterized membrane protein